MPVTYDFSGRVAVVTGASRGIGRGIATALAEAGAKVWNWDLEEVKNPPVRFQPVDVTGRAAIEKALEVATRKGAQPVDILVNNAGMTGGSQPVERFERALWRRIVEVNLTGVFEVSQAVLPALRRSPAGRIVNIASLAGKEGTPELSAYSAAKAGVIAFTKSMAKELATTPIRVNCIAPAAVETDILAQMAPETVATMIAKSPMGRLGTVEEVTAMALWLCSEECSFSTGAAFDVSGGRATY
jgi:3-oxoacyl-[acyl-carrier protein] reductase